MSQCNCWIGLLVLLVFASCVQQKPKPQPIIKKPLPIALSTDDFEEARRLISLNRQTENAQNIVAIYLMLHQQSQLKLTREIEYLLQFYPQMNATHRFMLDEIIKWVSLQQIYRDEISSSVRILQREALYLATSHVKFIDCDISSDALCQSQARVKLSGILTNQVIAKHLREMAQKDPCINLSTKPQGSIKANRCIEKNKGSLKIELLKKPYFSYNDWLLATEN